MQYSPSSAAYAQPRRGTLRITVHDASNFKAGDWMTSTSDAFVVAELVDYALAPGAPQWTAVPANARRTSVQKKSTKPVWNEVLDLDTDYHDLNATTLRLSLWDEDTGKLREFGSRSNDLLGFLVVDAQPILQGGNRSPTATMHESLFDKSGSRGDNGTLSFSLQYLDREEPAAAQHANDQLVQALRREVAELRVGVRGLELSALRSVERLEELRQLQRGTAAHAAGGVAQSLVHATVISYIVSPERLVQLLQLMRSRTIDAFLTWTVAHPLDSFIWVVGLLCVCWWVGPLLTYTLHELTTSTMEALSAFGARQYASGRQSSENIAKCVWRVGWAGRHLGLTGFWRPDMSMSQEPSPSGGGRRRRTPSHPPSPTYLKLHGQSLDGLGDDKFDSCAGLRPMGGLTMGGSGSGRPGATAGYMSSDPYGMMSYGGAAGPASPIMASPAMSSPPRRAPPGQGMCTPPPVAPGRSPPGRPPSGRMPIAVAQPVGGAYGSPHGAPGGGDLRL